MTRKRKARQGSRCTWERASPHTLPRAPVNGIVWEASRVSNRDELQECAREKVSVFLLRTTDTLRSMSWMFVPVI
jgi:hypothetical protein